MKKDLGVLTALFPMPVLLVASYDQDGTVGVMNVAWGTPGESDQVTLFVDEDHKTTKNILLTKAFTVSLADKAHLAEADFFGIASGNKMPDKFAKSGLHAKKSAHVNAPIIQEFPLAIECKLLEVVRAEHLFAIVGKVVNVCADEEVLSEKGKVEPQKLNAVLFDTFQSGYWSIGEKVGQAWKTGANFMQKS